MMTRTLRHKARQISLRAVLLAGMLVAGCDQVKPPEYAPDAIPGGERVALQTPGYVPLADLPRRSHAIPVAIYDFPDFTGTNAKSENFAELSKAVSQGADSYVVSALNSVGGGTWFRVMERRFLEPLLQERRIVIGQINETRQRAHVRRERARIESAKARVEAEVARLRRQIDRDYGVNGPSARPPEGLPPLDQTLANLERYRKDQLDRIPAEQAFSTFESSNPMPNLETAKYLISGAIVSYDHDVIAGGAGLRVVNVGLRKESRKDIITINLRLVDVATGAILSQKTVTQTVLSRKVQGDALDYVTLNTVLEFEAGYVVNEPRSFALEAAIRLALSEVLSDLSERDIL